MAMGIYDLHIFWFDMHHSFKCPCRRKKKLPGGKHVMA